MHRERKRERDERVKKRSRVKGGREKIKGRDIHGPTEVTRRNSSYTRIAFNKFKNISTETF